MSAQVEAFVNQAAWQMMNGKAHRDVVRLLEEACGGIRMNFVRDGKDIPRLVREALSRGSTMVVAAGGDGTVNAVASVLAGLDVSLGVLPAGTLNHFAKDLGIPADLGEAARLLATGSVARVDVGEVNGRIFINNSALGLYPDIVAFREARRRKGARKWSAAFQGLMRSLAHYRLLTVKVAVDGRELVRTTPIVFVGNNRYLMEGFGMGSRESIHGGELSLVIPHGTGRLRLFLYTAGALLGHGPGQALDHLTARELTIESHHPRLLVSLDGEVVHLDTPLSYRIHPGDLRVIVPRTE